MLQDGYGTEHVKTQHVKSDRLSKRGKNLGHSDLEGLFMELKFRTEFPFFLGKKSRRKRDLYEPLLTAMTQVLLSFFEWKLPWALQWTTSQDVSLGPLNLGLGTKLLHSVVHTFLGGGGGLIFSNCYRMLYSKMPITSFDGPPLGFNKKSRSRGKDEKLRQEKAQMSKKTKH